MFRLYIFSVIRIFSPFQISSLVLGPDLDKLGFLLGREEGVVQAELDLLQDGQEHSGIRIKIKFFMQITFWEFPLQIEYAYLELWIESESFSKSVRKYMSENST